MSLRFKEFDKAPQRERGLNHKSVDERKMLLGIGAIFAMAFLALGIRLLLPNLNPFILVGLGATVYGVYLGTLFLSHLSQAKDTEDSLETERVNKKER